MSYLVEKMDEEKKEFIEKNKLFQTDFFLKVIIFLLTINTFSYLFFEGIKYKDRLDFIKAVEEAEQAFEENQRLEALKELERIKRRDEMENIRINERQSELQRLRQNFR